MKTICVFGATGKTGKPFIKKALEKGYRVRALVRDPARLDFRHDNLIILKGDILEEQDVMKTIAGSDVIINLSGHVKGSSSDLQVQHTGHIIKAMKQHDIRRLITLTGGGVRDPENDNPGFIDKLIVFIMQNLAGSGARNALLDGRNHIDFLKKHKDYIEYTVVRAPVLNENPPTGKIEVGYVGKIKGFKLSRYDLAEFILKESEENRYVHKMPFLANAQ